MSNPRVLLLDVRSTTDIVDWLKVPQNLQWDNIFISLRLPVYPQYGDALLISIALHSIQGIDQYSAGTAPARGRITKCRAWTQTGAEECVNADRHVVPVMRAPRP